MNSLDLIYTLEGYYGDDRPRKRHTKDYYTDRFMGDRYGRGQSQGDYYEDGSMEGTYYEDGDDMPRRGKIQGDYYTEIEDDEDDSIKYNYEEAGYQIPA